MPKAPSVGSSKACPSSVEPFLNSWGSHYPRPAPAPPKADQPQQITTSTTDSTPAWAFCKEQLQISPDEIHERPRTTAARAPSPSMEGDVPDAEMPPDQQADKLRTSVEGASSHSMEATSSSAPAVPTYEPNEDEDVDRLADLDRAHTMFLYPGSSLAREAALIGSEEAWENRSRGNPSDRLLEEAQQLRTAVPGTYSLAKEESPMPSNQTISEPQSQNHMPHERTQHQTSQRKSHPRETGARARVGAQSGLGPGPGWGPYGPIGPLWAHKGPYGPIRARFCLKN